MNAVNERAQASQPDTSEPTVPSAVLSALAGSLDVVVLTYKRPDQLAAGLDDLLIQIRDLESAAPGLNVGLLVVDNDPAASARDVVESVKSPAVRYVVESQRGIAAARNRALVETSDRDAMVFIDDDERPREGWLVNLVDTYAESRPAAVMGRVVSRFPFPPEPWVVAGDFFTRPTRATGALIGIAATNNLLLDVRQIRSLGLQFDVALGLSGGEDNLFTRQIVAGGGRIVWCNEAVLDDDVPAVRLERHWLLHRSYSHGNTASVVDIRLARAGMRRVFCRVRRFLGGIGRISAGFARWMGGLVTGNLRHQARGHRGVYRGAGMMVGALGIVYQEYALREKI